MSRKDLEAYWDAREGFLKEQKLTEFEVLNSDKPLRDFYEFELELDRQLQAKDPRAQRALRYTLHLLLHETKGIVSEMFPNQCDVPHKASMRIAIGCRRSMCLLVYDALSHLALEAAECLMPLKPEAQA